MWHDIVTAALPIITSAAVAVLTALIGVVGAAATKWLDTKKAALVKQIGATEYNQKLSFAKTAWGMVEEEFRIHPELTKTIAAKQETFAAFIQKFLPEITPGEIETLRQAVAAEVNAGKAALTAPATEPAQPATDTAAAASTAQTAATAAGAAQ